jgi:endo-1,4-beta-xylanase
MFARAFLSALFLATPLLAAGSAPEKVVPLWAGGPPGFEARKNEKEVRDVRGNGEYRLTNVHHPTLAVFLPARGKATGAGVVIAPGGGHRELWMMHEGMNVAKWLADHGVAAFVLKYRLAREKNSPYKIAEHALQDGQRALRLVRSRAKEWEVDPARVGIMGFSAGGEVAAMVAGADGQGKADAADPIDRLGARPAFVALVYSGPLGVRGAKVTKDGPPTFILVGDKDNAVSWLVPHYQALHKAGVSAELHVYARAPHGFGLRPGKGQPAEGWPARFEEFLRAQGMLKKG